MALSEAELAGWTFLTDGLAPPEEFTPDDGKLPRIRIFYVPESDDRFPR